MQQKEISRWLKAITIVLALMGAVFFLYIMPVLAMSWRDADESLAYLFMPGLLTESAKTPLLPLQMHAMTVAGNFCLTMI